MCAHVCVHLCMCVPGVPGDFLIKTVIGECGAGWVKECVHVFGCSQVCILLCVHVCTQHAGQLLCQDRECLVSVGRGGWRGVHVCAHA